MLACLLYMVLDKLQVHHWNSFSWCLFTFNFSLMQSALTNFFIELVEMILPIVIFVMIYQKPFCTNFVNVKKFPPFGMNYVFFWLIMFPVNPLLSQILKKKKFVSQTSLNMTVALIPRVLISSFYARNFTFTDANFRKTIRILLHF